MDVIARVDGWSEGDDGRRLTTYQLIDPETGESLHVGTVDTTDDPADSTVKTAVTKDAEVVISDDSNEMESLEAIVL